MDIKYYKSSDGCKIAYRFWPAGTPAKNIFIYIHGIESHSGWFENTARLLAANGRSVYAPDRRGSGLSEGPRGDLSSYKEILADIRCLIRIIKDETPGTGIFLIGLSLGASIIINYALEYPDEAAGLVLMSPAIETLINVPFFMKLDIFISKILNPRKRFPIPITADMFSDSREVQEYIRKDELKINSVTASFYLELLRMKIIHYSKADKLKIPVLILLAERDRIIDNKAVVEWAERLNAGREIKVIKNACHSLQLETIEHENEIIQDILSWAESK
ncbi:MAG: lysophospholipase [Candidatus Aureabacteria bacterium]|nr:lysophospholipase [Candidatus Auribacterota bacterium]